jgi:hypothetical protein
VVISKNDVRCDALIKNNYIEKNKGCGVLVAGSENVSRIRSNWAISNNRFAGIKVMDNAHAYIFSNDIKGNFGQGILLMEGGTALIEKNEITTNFKANIAFGGEFSGNTVILNNNIALSRAEGVFALESGYTWLQGNTI